jgi:pyrimidine-nucleoside phosphorylase
MADWVDLIVRKRNSEGLEPEEVVEMVEAVQRDEVAPEQFGAFLMAAAINGLDDEETAGLAKALLKSGQVLSFADLGYPAVDVGETGGLGNNGAMAALVIAAVYGARVPVVAQKSQGLFGGLLDKFESIPGFRTDLPPGEFQENVRAHGIGVMGQSSEMAPADTKIHQIRTQTGTLNGASLTVASLLARKAAGGVKGLVAEIACGSGGIARDLSEAHQLADALFNVGENLGFHVTGLITNRQEPIGHAVGDCLELKETIQVLRGQGPEDLKEVTTNLASCLLVIGQLATDHAQGVQLAEEALADGRAFEKLKEIVSHQGGDSMAIENPDHLPRGQSERQVTTQRGGYIKSIDCEALGRAWMQLGGSRQNRGDSTDHRVGLVVHKKVGERVERGESLVTMHTSEKSKIEPATEAVEEAFLISPDPAPGTRPIIENFGRRR